MSKQVYSRLEKSHTNSKQNMNHLEEVVCKVCNKSFKHSTILKHVNHKKKCKFLYTKDGIQDLEQKASKRKKKIRALRDRIYGDPMTRSHRRAELYNPEKRRAIYQRSISKKKVLCVF